MNILLNNNSTTEEDTEEEINPAINTNKRTKRRRRNFSSSTSSSYTSSSLTTNSNNTNNVVLSRKSGNSQQPQPGSNSEGQRKDLIAYRTRSRTQSVEQHSEIEFSTTTKGNNTSAQQQQKQSVGRTSTSSKQQKLQSDKEECGTHKEGEKSARTSIDKSVGGDKNITNCKKTITETINNRKSQKEQSESNFEHSNSVNIENNQQNLRKLRSQAKPESDSVEPKHNLRRKIATSSSSGVASVVPKKRQRISDNSNLDKSTTGSSSKGETSAKTSNLGARLARGREPHFSNQDLIEPSTSIQSGHPPPTSSQNLLRRSSRGKTSTTGSCVSKI